MKHESQREQELAPGARTFQGRLGCCLCPTTMFHTRKRAGFECFWGGMRSSNLCCRRNSGSDGSKVSGWEATRQEKEKSHLINVPVQFRYVPWGLAFVILSPFYRGSAWGSEREGHSSQLPKLECGRARVRMPTCEMWHNLTSLMRL